MIYTNKTEFHAMLRNVRADTDGGNFAVCGARRLVFFDAIQTDDVMHVHDIHYALAVYELADPHEFIFNPDEVPLIEKMTFVQGELYDKLPEAMSAYLGHIVPKLPEAP